MAESPGYPNLIAARSTADEAPTDLAMEPDSRSLYVAPWTWNTDSLVWEKIADVNSKLDLITGLLEGIGRFYKFDYNVGKQLIYKGVNAVHGAADAATDWQITKYTYNGDGDITIIEGPLTGTWTGRALLEFI